MIVQLLTDAIELGIGWFGLLVFVLVTLVAELGFRLGDLRRRRRAPPDKEISGLGTLTAGMLGLMAFMLALTISFSQDRFEARRHTTVLEANAIGTVWLRTDLAGEAGRPLAALVEQYARLRQGYLEAPGHARQIALLASTAELQGRIWRDAMALAPTIPPPFATSLVTAINDMFDASLSQRYAIESRPPIETSLMLLLGAMLTVGGLGYQMGLTGYRHLVLALLLLAMLTGGIMLIVDFSRPRLGFTQIDTRPLIWTIQGFTPTPR